MRWTNLQPGEKFPPDSVYQKLLTSVHVWQSYSKNKKVAVFGTQCIIPVAVFTIFFFKSLQRKLKLLLLIVYFLLKWLVKMLRCCYFPRAGCFYLLLNPCLCCPVVSCPSYDDCLEDKREDYQNCSVLYCVPQLYPEEITKRSSYRWTRAFRFRFSFF